MAQSRTYRYGNIFVRAAGLLRSGAMKPEERPMWMDIYAVFPPLDEPNYNGRSLAAPQPPRSLILADDAVRRVFYDKYHGGVIGLTSKQDTLCQRFVDKVRELALQSGSKPGITLNSLCDKAAEMLRSEGVHLRELDRPWRQKRIGVLKQLPTESDESV